MDLTAEANCSGRCGSSQRPRWSLPSTVAAWCPAIMAVPSRTGPVLLVQTVANSSDRRGVGEEHCCPPPMVLPSREGNHFRKVSFNLHGHPHVVNVQLCFPAFRFRAPTQSYNVDANNTAYISPYSSFACLCTQHPPTTKRQKPKSSPPNEASVLYITSWDLWRAHSPFIFSSSCRTSSSVERTQRGTKT